MNENKLWMATLVQAKAPPHTESSTVLSARDEAKLDLQHLQFLTIGTSPVELLHSTRTMEKTYPPGSCWNHVSLLLVLEPNSIRRKWQLRGNKNQECLALLEAVSMSKMKKRHFR